MLYVFVFKEKHESTKGIQVEQQSNKSIESRKKRWETCRNIGSRFIKTGGNKRKRKEGITQATKAELGDKNKKQKRNLSTVSIDIMDFSSLTMVPWKYSKYYS